MRRFGSFQLDPKLFSHFKRVPRAAEAQSSVILC